MKSKALFGTLLSLFFFAFKPAPKHEYQIIPEPQDITYAKGSVSLGRSVKVVFPEELKNEFQLLENFLDSDFQINLKKVNSWNKADIILEINSSKEAKEIESYTLKVDEEKIKISSGSSAGILNGIQTLRQIIKEEGNGFLIQRGTIKDNPAFSWRAFMLDEARHFKGKEVVKQLLDEMSFLKMNTFHWHLTDDQGWRIEIKKYPKLTEIGARRDSTEINHFHSNVFDGKPHSGYYTQDEIREIVDYATKRHIQIVPEIEMPGHSSAAIAAYPWLGVTGENIDVPTKFGVHYDVYDVTKPKVLEFFNDIFDEVIALFPSPVIHIGGDEIRYDQWKSSESIQEYMVENNLETPAELQVFFTNNISSMLKEKNKRMMGWNEIKGDKLHDYQSDSDTKQLGQSLAEETIIQFWKGDPQLMTKSLKEGYEIVNSYHVYTYLDYSYKSIPLSKAYSFNPIPDGLKKEDEKKVLGLGCQMWGEFIPTVEDMQRKVFPRIAAYAEVGWSGRDKKDYERFKAALPNLLKRWKNKGIIYGEIADKL
ncbi:hexosaminidase [Salegentibacter echinorum]|uniref:beta-N-acetylhexosaminidase n=1 Tax=Salegentibacter echinorum TaxID=1073325 RepID=A0A1M5EAI0_SALEC|nr:beta-N-acetylhexosaminidase [Salegentibacter echinorum]SHF76207.1 hexosaminidase [Salegentibacter echinorum]